MMISLSTQYYQFILAQGIVSGFGQSCVATTVMSCIMTWFRRRRAAALGIAISGSAVGGVVMPIMFTQLIPRVGFPWAMRIVAFMCLGLCLTACVLVKSRLKPKPEPLLLKDYTGPFKEKTMLLLYVGCLLFFGGMFVPASYIIVQAQAAGVNAALLGYLLPIWSAARLVFLSSSPSDNYSRFMSLVSPDALSQGSSPTSSAASTRRPCFWAHPRCSLSACGFPECTTRTPSSRMPCYTASHQAPYSASPRPASRR